MMMMTEHGLGRQECEQNFGGDTLCAQLEDQVGRGGTLLRWSLRS